MKYINLRLHNFENKYRIYQDLQILTKIIAHEESSVSEDDYIVDLMSKYQLLRVKNLDDILKDLNFKHLFTLICGIENDIMDKLIDLCDDNYKEPF